MNKLFTTVALYCATTKKLVFLFLNLKKKKTFFTTIWINKLTIWLSDQQHTTLHFQFQLKCSFYWILIENYLLEIRLYVYRNDLQFIGFWVNVLRYWSRNKSSSLTCVYTSKRLCNTNRVFRVIHQVSRDSRQRYNADEGKLKCISKILSKRQAAWMVKSELPVLCVVRIKKKLSSD